MEIICRDVCKGIRIKRSLFGYDKINVLNNLNYTIKQGEIIALMGASNSGKSTFINLLVGESVVDSGEILVDGESNIHSLRENSAVIRDFNSYKFKEEESVYNNLLAQAKKAKISEVDSEKIIVDLKNVLDFEKVINKKIVDLDEVDKIKVVIALSIMKRPNIIYFDNSLIHLGAVIKNIVLKTLKRLNKEFKTTIVIASVDFMDIEKICKRVSILKDGKIVVDGDFDSIKKKYFSNKIISITFNKMVNVPKGDFEIVDSSEYFMKLKVDFDKCDFASLINQFDVKNIIDISIASIPLSGF